MANLPAKLRKFLMEKFSDEEVVDLCFDHFPEVYNDFTEEMTKAKKVRNLVDYCQRRERIPDLQAALFEKRPEQYEATFSSVPLTRGASQPPDQQEWTAVLAANIRRLPSWVPLSAVAVLVALAIWGGVALFGDGEEAAESDNVGTSPTATFESAASSESLTRPSTPPPLTPTNTPPPTAAPDTVVLNVDECDEANDTADSPCTIGLDESITLNFVPRPGNSQDIDYLHTWIKPGYRYTCETYNLSVRTDTIMTLLDSDGNDFQPRLSNDDKASGDFGSRVSYQAGYTGWLIIVIEQAAPPAYKESPMYTYNVVCTTFVPTATPEITPSRTPASASTSISSPFSTSLPTSTPGTPATNPFLAYSEPPDYYNGFEGAGSVAASLELRDGHLYADLTNTSQDHEGSVFSAPLDQAVAYVEFVFSVVSGSDNGKLGFRSMCIGGGRLYLEFHADGRVASHYDDGNSDNDLSGLPAGSVTLEQEHKVNLEQVDGQVIVYVDDTKLPAEYPCEQMLSIELFAAANLSHRVEGYFDYVAAWLEVPSF